MCGTKHPDKHLFIAGSARQRVALDSHISSPGNYVLHASQPVKEQSADTCLYARLTHLWTLPSLLNAQHACLYLAKKYKWEAAQRLITSRHCSQWSLPDMPCATHVDLPGRWPTLKWTDVGERKTSASASSWRVLWLDTSTMVQLGERCNT